MATIKNYIIAQLQQIRKSGTKGLSLSNFLRSKLHYLLFNTLPKESGVGWRTGGAGRELEQICLWKLMKSTVTNRLYNRTSRDGYTSNMPKYYCEFSAVMLRTKGRKGIILKTIIYTRIYV